MMDYSTIREWQKRIEKAIADLETAIYDGRAINTADVATLIDAYRLQQKGPRDTVPARPGKVGT